MKLEKLEIRTMADIEEYEKTPLARRLKVSNTYELIKQGCAINPDAPAISFFFTGEDWVSPEIINYRELMAGITRAANLFNDMGIGKKDVISYLLPNLPQTHFVLWGGEAAGIVNPINYLLEPSTITDICRAAGTKILVALGDMPGWDIWQKAEKVREELPGLKALVKVMGSADERRGVYAFDELLPRYSADKLDSRRLIDPQDIASMYHTGGTTGTPKLAPHSHFNEAFMACVTGATTELRTGETTMCGLPLFHVNGTTVTGSMPFSMGAHVVLLSARGYRDPAVIKNFYRIVEKYRAVTFSAVPTILSVLLDTPKGDADLSSLRFLVCGAAPLSVELFRRFEAHSGMKIIEGYGLTEGTCVSSLNPFHGERRIGSIGLRLPYQDMRIFVLDEDGRFVREAEDNEIGSVCIKGPNVFSGYLDPAHNKHIWAKPGWLNTGDLGRRDKDGYFWLTGRKKELIIRGGHNIDPASIEEPLYRMRQVKVAAAVGSPDPYAGEVPVAYVELKDGETVSEEEILGYLKREVGERAAVPKKVFVIPRMPLTPVGKIFKPALRWAAIKRVFEEDLAPLGTLTSGLEVKVVEDKIHGAVAKILVKPARDVARKDIEDQVTSILGRYTVRFEIVFLD